MKFVIFTIFVMIAMAMVVSEEVPAECSPWLGYCQTSDQCCRHLQCSSYTAKCVPKGVIVIPGLDKRPVGPGPFPPGYIP